MPMVAILPVARRRTEITMEKCRDSITAFSGALLRPLNFRRKIRMISDDIALNSMPIAPRGWLKEEISAPNSLAMIQNRSITSIRADITVAEK